MCDKYTAWMIREDGKAIPCVQHIYGSLDCIEETLYAAEWLYKHTLKDETKDLVLRLISAYALSLNTAGDPDQKMLQKIQGQPYITLTPDFIQEIRGELSGTEEDLGELNRIVCEELNKEFLRARLGGMYGGGKDNRDMYFRVSSDDQNWAVLVKGFVAGHKDDIETVTVVYDEESTGHGEFLKDKTGNDINHMPTGTFYKDRDCPL